MEFTLRFKKGKIVANNNIFEAEPQKRRKKMRLEGRLFVGSRLTEIKEVVTEDTDGPFSKQLEKALVLLCKEMDIPVPIWMKKNTKEFAAFHQTIFFSEQYPEKVRFDRFQIRMTE
jgi:hypothetical protein